VVAPGQGGHREAVRGSGPIVVETTQFVGHPTSIPGLLVFEVTVLADDRGWFQEKYQHEKLVAAGLPEDFSVVQNSLSFNRQRGVTRGFHAEPWDKYISIVTGAVFAAYLDLRAGPTFGRVETVELDATKAVFLPEGVANSFQTLTDDTYYLYSVNRHWKAGDYDQYAFVNLADPDAAVSWPIDLDLSIVSARDRQHPNLKDLTPLRPGQR
jgi:dTDP-4-dehydrorhamnose 3,5-epimerase